MSAGRPSSDPVERYVAELAAAVHGPARVKSRLIEEIREGLTDTVEAYARGGLSREEAARRAVREFGTPEELAPSWQRELTIAQARHTARAAGLTVPLLVVCLLLLRGAVDDGWGVLGLHLAGVAVAAALLAAGALAATGSPGRRLRVPSRLPLVVAWSGTGAAMAMGVGALGFVVVAVLDRNWPLTALAGALAAASHALLASTARTCRQYARLPLTPRPT
ncbi:permease prefix domain 1-containing protein [Streptomyces sp. NPDC001889]